MEKLCQDYFYLKTKLTFSKNADIQMDRTRMKMIVTAALQTLHGQVGGSIPVDVLTCSVNENGKYVDSISILRVPYQEITKVWSALTLLGSYDGRLCKFQVSQVSGSLMSLALRSRDYQFPS